MRTLTRERGRREEGLKYIGRKYVFPSADTNFVRTLRSLAVARGIVAFLHAAKQTAEPVPLLYQSLSSLPRICAAFPMLAPDISELLLGMRAKHECLHWVVCVSNHIAVRSFASAANEVCVVEGRWS